MRPTPVWNGARGVWQVDLRTPWRLGRRVVQAAPPPHGLVDAVHAARDLLSRLLLERGEGSQLTLPGTGSRTLAEAIKDYLAVRVWASNGGERWTRETCKALVRELGPRSLAGLDATALWAYRDAVRSRGLGPKAAQSRLVVLKQILRWCSEPPRLWLPFVPPFPSCKVEPDELINNPLSTWVDHATFRAVRARIYEHQTARNGLAAFLRRQGRAGSAAEVRDLVERRRLYLSFAFYTGMRREDLNGIDDGFLSIDCRVYYRHSKKTHARVVPERLPKPFALDIAAELRRLGRPFLPGEAICGGPWKNSCRVLASAAVAAGVPAFDLRTCRRSFVMHKALAGVPLDGPEGLIELLGHRDSSMIRAVYLQVPPRFDRDRAGGAWPDDVSALPGTGRARVLNFPEVPCQGQKDTEGGS